MTKISYEENEKNARVEMQGSTRDLFKGICRIVANAKANFESKDGKDFNELLLEGIETAEREMELQKILKNKSDATADSLLKLLEKLLDD